MILPVLWLLYKSPIDNANDSLINDIPTFDVTPNNYFYCILKLENIAAVTKRNPKQLAQGFIIKCFISLTPETSWNKKKVKAALRQEFLLGPTVTHVAARLKV